VNPRSPRLPRYHSTVSEVRLTFFATEHNQSIAQLQQHDFAVVDNGLVVRDFRSFGRSGVTQLEVLLLVDSSRTRTNCAPSTSSWPTKSCM
jgi:hypothetical protein